MRLYQLKNDLLQAHQKSGEFFFFYDITGAKTGKLWTPQPNIIVGYDTGDFTQAACDALLGSTNEFVTATAFGSTAMGTDALGFILNCDGQLKSQAATTLTISGNSVTSCEVLFEVFPLIGTTQTTSIHTKAQTTVLPNSLAAPARLQVSSAGNVAGQIVISGLDAATAGLLVFKISPNMK